MLNCKVYVFNAIGHHREAEIVDRFQNEGISVNLLNSDSLNDIEIKLKEIETQANLNYIILICHSDKENLYINNIEYPWIGFYNILLKHAKETNTPTCFIAVCCNSAGYIPPHTYTDINLVLILALRTVYLYFSIAAICDLIKQSEGYNLAICDMKSRYYKESLVAYKQDSKIKVDNDAFGMWGIQNKSIFRPKDL